MKRFIIALLLISALFTSCNDYSNQGLDNFSINDSSLELTTYLIPENFIEKFEYVDGNYYYDDSSVIPFYAVCERVLIYIQYEEDVYISAKEFAITNLYLSEEITEEYNQYVFYYSTNNESRNINDDNLPYTFVKFAYNDTKHTLIFMAFDVSVELYDEVDQYLNDWGAFLDKYYGEWYDFSA